MRREYFSQRKALSVLHTTQSQPLYESFNVFNDDVVLDYLSDEDVFSESFFHNSSWIALAPDKPKPGIVGAVAEILNVVKDLGQLNKNMFFVRHCD